MMGGFGMGFMGIFWVIVIVLVAVFVWQYIKQDKDQGDSRDSPLDTLKQRYARGEIDKEEYDEKKRLLLE